jgi:hypothetical protein
MTKQKQSDMTQKERVLKVLSRKNRNTLTVRQAKTELGIANVRAVVSSLRKEGHDIQTEAKTNRDGSVELYYAL